QGIEVVGELTGLEAAIENASIVLTGEGKIDNQTMYGKTISGVAKIAKKYSVPVVVVTGQNDVTDNQVYENGITAIFSIVNGPISLQKALEQSSSLIEMTTENICRMFVNVKSF